MSTTGKSQHNEPIRLEIIQRSDGGTDGLRTLKLHSNILPRTAASRIVEVKIVDSSQKVEEVAIAYLRACEDILCENQFNSPYSTSPKKDLPNRDWRKELKNSQLLGFKTSSTDKVGTEERLAPVQSGKVQEFLSKGSPLIKEISFKYRYAGYLVYQAHSKIELRENNQLVSATVVIPSDVNQFSDWSLGERDELEDALGIVKEKAGYSEIPDEWVKGEPLKWYFDRKKKRWILAYIVENVLKKRELENRQYQYHQQEEKTSPQWGRITLPIVNYAIEASNLHHITEI
jgi:hypothetical protein